MSKNHLTFNAVGNLVSSGLDTKIGHLLFHAAASTLMGFLSSRAIVFGSYAPFGIAAVAASSSHDGIFVLLGALIGYLVPYGAKYPARYIAAAIIVLVFKWLLAGFRDVLSHPAARPLIAGGSAFITGMTIVINAGMLPYDLVLCIAETLLCGCSVIFLQNALPLLREPSKLWGARQQLLVSVTISICILLLALSRVQAGGLSLGRILGVFAVLIAAKYGGEAGGSITGIAIGLILSLGDKTMAYIVACYGFGGLIAGIFTPLGKFACTAAFVLANAVSGVYFDQKTIVAELYEVLIASVAFMALPERVLCRLSALFVPAREGSGFERIREAVISRLLSAAESLADISHTVNEVTDKLRKMGNGSDISIVFHNAADCTCEKCGMKMFCWETAYNDTMDVFNSITEKLKKNSQIEKSDFPAHFSVRCCKLSDMANSVNTCYAEYVAKKGAELKNSQLRNILSDQLGGISSLLKGMAAETASSSDFEYAGSDRVRASLASCGLDLLSSACRVDGKGRMSVEAEVPLDSKKKVSKRQVMAQLFSACGVAFEEPVVTSDGNVIRVKFAQRPEFSARFGKAFIRKDGECLCGDCCTAFLDDRSRALMILSDGMGCGGSAAVDSNLATQFMSKLLRSGFDFDASLNIVNSAIMLKSSEESFATLDIACIDLFSGEAEFLKAGAPCTYLRRCGRAERVTLSSMPVGILRGVKFERKTVRMHSGDLIVLLSDGAVNDSDDWLIRELETFKGESVSTFAQNLVKMAKEKRIDGHDDDITVLIAALF